MVRTREPPEKNRNCCHLWRVFSAAGPLRVPRAEPLHPGSKEQFANFPLDRVTTKRLRVLRDRKANAPGWLVIGSRLLAWCSNGALDEELITTNPARDLSRLPIVGGGDHSWTVEEVAQFEAREPLGTNTRLALALLMSTGVRRSDVVQLGRQHAGSGWLKFVQAKNSRRKPMTIEVRSYLSYSAFSMRARVAISVSSYSVRTTVHRVGLRQLVSRYVQGGRCTGERSWAPKSRRCCSGRKRCCASAAAKAIFGALARRGQALHARGEASPNGGRREGLARPEGRSLNSEPKKSFRINPRSEGPDQRAPIRGPRS